jgi:Flp pilus assembly protein TadB
MAEMKDLDCAPETREVREKESRRSETTARAGRLKGLAVEITGWALVVAGVAGLFLPVLQGILLLLAGLLILTSRHRWASRLLEKLLVHFPSLRDRIRGASEHGEARPACTESNQAASAGKAEKIPANLR